MKLIYCNTCNDVVALSKKPRSCYCGSCGGQYKEDKRGAIVWGPCSVYGVSNKLFKLNQPAEAWPYDESNGVIERLPIVQFLDNDKAGLWYKGTRAVDLGEEFPGSENPPMSLQLFLLLPARESMEIISLVNPYERGLVKKLE